MFFGPLTKNSAIVALLLAGLICVSAKVMCLCCLHSSFVSTGIAYGSVFFSRASYSITCHFFQKP
jgi:hypothetical protein